jgi:acyl carrier protein
MRAEADDMGKIDAALDLIARVSGVERSALEPDMELVANLGLDSAKALELLVALEEQLGVEIADEDAAALNTVGDILRYLEGVPAART